MKPLNIHDYLITIFATFSLFSFFTNEVSDSQMHLSNIFEGMHLLGGLLIAGILYLGYIANVKYGEYHKSRNR